MTQCSERSRASQSARGAGLLRSYLQLTKAGLNGAVVFTTFVGYMAAQGSVHSPRLLWTLMGTAGAALGISAVNQWAERRRDALMQRTRHRPLPAGRLTAAAGLTLGLVLALGGDVLLLALVNPLTAGLALLTQLVYMLVYTPLKVRTPLATFAGAVCGAIPPLMGFSAATGGLPREAWILSALLFAWQVPHSLALAWQYREDYRQGGYHLLPVVEHDGQATARVVLLYTLALLPVALALVLAGRAGLVFAAAAVVLELLLLASAVGLFYLRSAAAARRLFLASIAYLVLLLTVLLLDSRPAVHEAAAAPAPATSANSTAAEAVK